MQNISNMMILAHAFTVYKNHLSQSLVNILKTTIV